MIDRLITTLPIGPYDKFSVGKMTTPILGESLAKSMDCQFVMSLNLLDCYTTRDSAPFINLLKQYNISPNYYWIDKEYVDELTDKIYILSKNRYIGEKEKEILKCSCGKVEIAKENINSINMKDSLLEIKNNSYYCKLCHSKCTCIKEKVLVFNSKLVDKTEMKFYPNFINKDKITFDKTVGNNDIIISRKRNTGILFDYNHRSYNLDIDFLWEVFLSLFNEQEKIVICCNHQLYQLYMVGMLEKCFNKKSNTICLATPYLEYSPNEIELKNRIMSLKIFSLLGLKWAKKENRFDNSLLNYINTMNIEKKQMLYDILIENIETTSDISEDLRVVLTKKYNFQNSNNELRRRRKNV